MESLFGNLSNSEVMGSQAKEIFSTLLRDKRVDVNILDNRGEAALLAACRRPKADRAAYHIPLPKPDRHCSRRQFIEFLLTDPCMEGRELDVNCVDRERGETPLVRAVREQQVGMDEPLLQSRRHVSIQDGTAERDDGMAAEKPVDLDSYWKQQQALQNWSNPQSTTEIRGISSDRGPSQRPWYKPVCALLAGDPRVDVNKADFAGKTPLMWACRHSLVSVVEILLLRRKSGYSTI
jgi:ankyrin repeat protein